MKTFLATLLLAAAAFAAQAADVATVDAALARAKQARQPVFIDFTAPWCYSCYFMASHVLNGAEWDALKRRAVTVEVDADSPDGAAWMKKLEVKALPAYVVLDENGNERGRILAEQPRAKFYPMVDAILAGAGTLDDYRAKAQAGDAEATRTVLASYQALGDDVGKDRNAADNLRVYLAMAKRTSELDALYPKLIAAYPDDYVYPYRWGRSLLERGDAAKALPLLEQAAEKAYGVNRLTVAKLRVDALTRLGRAEEAKSVANEVLELNGAWFPQQSTELRKAAGIVDALH